MFADVRTYWSPEAVKRATGYELEGIAKESGGFIHLINSGACCLDANGEARDENGNGVMKRWWEVTEADQKAIMENTTWNYADPGLFPRRRLFFSLFDPCRNAGYDDPSEPRKRSWPGFADR